jgi:predicted amidohydrolase YtcJ
MLPRDIMTMPEAEIPRMAVLMTMVGGRVVYQQEGFEAALSGR